MLDTPLAIPLQLAGFAAGMVWLKLVPQPTLHRWLGAALALGAMLWVLAAPQGSAVLHALGVAGGGYLVALVIVRRVRPRRIEEA